MTNKAQAANKADIWGQAEKTDPKYTKEFNRGGGFKGTAINATYLAKRATEVFGPIGTGWGVEIVNEEMLQGAPVIAGDGQILCHEIIHKVLVKFWYVIDGQRGELYQFGQTQFVGRNKNGLFTDEEAPKKSLTDAMTKCMSLLGFGADVHLGLFDDNKYVNALRQEFAEANGQGQQQPAQNQGGGQQRQQPQQRQPQGQPQGNQQQGGQQQRPQGQQQDDAQSSGLSSLPDDWRKWADWYCTRMWEIPDLRELQNFCAENAEHLQSLRSVNAGAVNLLEQRRKTREGMLSQAPNSNAA